MIWIRALVFLLVAVASATAAYAQSASAGANPLPPANYLGNPNITASAIVVDGIASFGSFSGSAGPAKSTQFDADAANVDVDTDIITTNAPHPFTTGNKVQITASTGKTVPTGLLSALSYFVCAVSPTQLRLYVHYRNAMACTRGQVDIKSAGAGSSQTIVDRSVYKYPDVALQTVSGSGSGARALVLVTNDAGTMKVSDLMVTTPGSGYTTGTVVTANPPDVGGASGFSATVDGVGFALSRPSGKIPAFVMASAQGISATGGTGTPQPWEDLQYSWNCGGEAEKFVRPTDRETVDANTDQTGPMATCVYRTPGEKAITLTITANNNGTLISTTHKRTFNAIDFKPSGGEFWFNPTEPGVGRGRGTFQDPWTGDDVRTNLLPKIVSAGAKANIAIHIKRGSKFSGPAGLQSAAPDLNGLRIDDCEDSACKKRWGTGDDPIIEITGPADAFFFSTHSPTREKRDIVISNIKFVQRQNGSSCGTVFGAKSHLSDIYLDRGMCDMSSLTTNRQALSMGAGNRMGLWGFNILQPDADGTVQNPTALTGGANHWSFFLGSDLSGWGGANAPGFYHGIYFAADRDFHVVSNVLFRWLNIYNGRNKNNAIKLRIDNGGGFFLADQNSISDIGNGFAASGDVIDAGPSYSYNVICSGNALFAFRAGQGTTGCFAGGDTTFSFTVRDNRFWAGEAFAPRILKPDHGEAAARKITAYKVYRNKGYTVDQYTQITFENFLGQWTSRQVITDNTFVGTGRANIFLSLVWPDAVAAGSVFRRNHYYSPNDPSPFLDGRSKRPFDGVARSWQGQGWDPSPGSFSSSACPPSWTCPVARWQDMGR